LLVAYCKKVVSYCCLHIFFSGFVNEEYPPKAAISPSWDYKLR
jgi:hypothetical protein